MATSPEAVRSQLAVVSAAAARDLFAAASEADFRERLAAMFAALRFIVPSYYDAAGSLALAWYEELREESRPSSLYVPAIIGDPATDWIEREIEAFRETLETDLEAETQRLMDEMAQLAAKEVARGYRDTILGNTRQDEDAIGWSRVARPGACKLCRMLANKGAVFSESTAIFAAHTDCNCAARPEFRNGEHGPEASVEQYLASQKRRTAAQKAALRAYLNENYPDAPG